MDGLPDLADASLEDDTVSLRQKLLLLFSLTVAAAVAAVAWTVLVRIRQVFETRDQEETALFVSQFQREFQHQLGGRGCCS